MGRKQLICSEAGASFPGNENNAVPSCESGKSHTHYDPRKIPAPWKTQNRSRSASVGCLARALWLAGPLLPTDVRISGRVAGHYRTGTQRAGSDRH